MEVQPQELTLLAQQWPVWGAGMNSGVGVGVAYGGFICSAPGQGLAQGTIFRGHCNTSLTCRGHSR